MKSAPNSDKLIFIMVINWYGEGCFKIQSGGLTLSIDPFQNSSGLNPPRFKADITLKTLSRLPIEYENSAASVIAGSGEYEISNIEISGFSSEAAGDSLKTAYLVKTPEDLTLGFLGHLSQNPKPELLENLRAVDILFIPAGGSPYLSQEAAAKLVRQINPKIAVASFFKIPGLASKVSDAKEFLKELGQKAEPEESLTVKKKDLPAVFKVVLLKA